MARIRTYTTVDGDMLDLVCYRHYRGRQAGAVEAVIEANRHIRLSEMPPRLPRGLTIILPDLPAETTRAALVKLWD
jgi:phage tail protein X